MEMLLVVVFVVAFALAAGMAALAWRLLRWDRRRTEAHAATLTALADTDPALEPDVTADQYDIAYQSPDLFDAHARHPSSGSRWGSVVVVVMMCMAIGAGAVYGLYGPSLSDASPLSRFPWLSSTSSRSAAPLELLSLSHRAEANGQFVVTGLVQNRSAGRLAPNLVAVVYLFDQDGQYFATGKASLEFASLPPGDESPFVVRIPAAAKVSRFRVGFRQQDGGVVPHADRRGQPIEGTTASPADLAR